MGKNLRLTEAEKAIVRAMRAANGGTRIAFDSVMNVVPSAAAPRTFYTPAEVKAGLGFPCTADGGCGRKLKTAGRASKHGIDAGGHAAKA